MPVGVRIARIRNCRNRVGNIRGMGRRGWKGSKSREVGILDYSSLTASKKNKKQKNHPEETRS